ncbi:MAG: aspartyl/asparaginyl beta-hydroxylase domain-containing protein [Pseudoalteromonas prydzensis]|uniref:aspartyl/asparaginyl beta-hydroxylase domain-containing protein n=1 Tax=Pseudoalteromonas prydzensis TaxID=182141 RepID=UPI003F99108A
MITQSVAYAQLSIPFGEFKLAEDLLVAEQCCWVDHVNENDYQGKWDVLPLNVPKEYVDGHPILQSFMLEPECAWVNGPNLTYLPAFKSLLGSLKCDILSARLMRLHPHSSIKPHRDIGLSIEKSAQVRIHFCLACSADVEFCVDGQQVPMVANTCWYINADAVHSVKNKGQLPRINLVVDCVANQWIYNLLGASVNAAEVS